MKKVLKITAYVFGSILLLLTGVLVYLNSPWGQSFVRGRAEAYLRDKLKTEVHIGFLGYGFPKYIVINDALFLDRGKDTLLSVRTLRIDLDMWQLFHKKVNVQEIVLQGVHSHIYRNNPDTTFNFSYIINAFAGNSSRTSTNAKDTASSLSFKLGRVKLGDIHVRYNDGTGGVQFGMDLDALSLNMKNMNVNSMLFHIKDLSVKGLKTVFNQDTSYLRPTPADTARSRMKIIADNIDLRDISFNYNSSLNKLLFALQLGALQLQLNEYDRGNNRVDIKKLAVSNSRANLTIGRSSRAPAPVDTIVKIDTTAGWTVKAKDIDLSGLNFKMDDDNVPRQPGGIDYSHLDLRNLALRLSNLLYANEVSGEIKHMAVSEQSGLDIREFKTAFKYNATGVVLKDILLQTPNTIIRNYVEIHYPSIAILQKRTQTLQIKVNVVNSIVGLRDLLLFAPFLEKQELFRRYKNSRFPIEAKATGTIDRLDIARFYVRGFTNTEVDLSGALSGLPDANKLSYNLHIAKFTSSRDDITAVLPPNTLPSSFRIPDRFGVVGQIAGNVKDYKVSLLLAGTDGGASVSGMVATSPGAGREQYDLTVKTAGLNVGHILRQDSLIGFITAGFNVKGRGFDVKTMNASADGYISSVIAHGYRYHDISLKGSVAGRQADAVISVNDTNLQMKVSAKADFSGKYAAVAADLLMDSIDFRALKLYSAELSARGRIHADFPELDPDYPRGSIAWYQAVILADGKRYFVDSMYAKSSPDAGGQNISIDLGAFAGNITGKTPLSKIPAIVQDHINRHFATIAGDRVTGVAAKPPERKPAATGTDTAAIPSDYNLVFNAHLLDKPMLHSLLTGLTSFDSVHIDGSLTPRNLSFNANTAAIEYGPFMVANALVQLRGSDSALTYKLTVDQVSQSNFSFYYADLNGTLDRNMITGNVSLSDAGKKERFALKATMQTTGDSQVVRLQPGLKLNYNTWEVAPANKIVLKGKGFYVRDFGISYKEQSVKANSDIQQPDAPLKIDIASFQLSDLTDIASKNDTLIANGLLNGKITIEHISPELEMTGDLQIQNLSVYNDTLGDLQATVSNKKSGQLDTRISLKGFGNDIALSGFYAPGQPGSDAFNFSLDVHALALHSFEGLAMHQVNNSSGYVRGSLKVRGSISNPDITGELHTDNLKTNITAVNSDFRMPAEKITFSTGKIILENFSVLDSAGNKARIDGAIGISDMLDPDLKLVIKAQNWRAIHSTTDENKDLYGDLILNVRLDISGTAQVPSVDGDIHILKGTKLTVTNPQKNPEVESSKGIVVFVNMRDSSNGKVLMSRSPDSTKSRRKLAVGSDMNVNVTIDKDAAFNIIIDEASGDFISLQGEAYFNASVTPGGVMAIAGNYLLHSGVYQMNYNFIKRKFLIQDGSTITFAGDPVRNTTMDVNAIYLANTPAYDLVMRQVTDPAQLNYYKQSLPFDVVLHMKGNVMQPAFTFDVTLPEDKVYPLSPDQVELIQAKLSQVRQDSNELNKQVFAVLILGRFVSDDPFTSGAGQSLQFSAMQSVSTFIGEQLNRAANKLVKGVDLSVDLATTADYTTGDMRQRTDLNVAASKRVLNDRLKLTVGNDFEVEGPQTASNQSNLVPSNLAADYLLTSDGRYTVRVYRRNYDEGLLQGYVTETGVNFIMSVDYDIFKSIFMRSKPKKQPEKGTGQ